jgi:hypothetical protein
VTPGSQAWATATAAACGHFRLDGQPCSPSRSRAPNKRVLGQTRTASRARQTSGPARRDRNERSLWSARRRVPTGTGPRRDHGGAFRPERTAVPTEWSAHSGIQTRAARRAPEVGPVSAFGPSPLDLGGPSSQEADAALEKDGVDGPRDRWRDEPPFSVPLACYSGCAERELARVGHGPRVGLFAARWHVWCSGRERLPPVTTG